MHDIGGRYAKLYMLTDGQAGWGVGQVDRKDAQKRHCLNEALLYLSKPDPYGRIAFGSGVKLLTHGRTLAGGTARRTWGRLREMRWILRTGGPWRAHAR